MHKGKLKQWLCLLLALCAFATALPALAIAEGDSEGSASATAELMENYLGDYSEHTVDVAPDAAPSGAVENDMKIVFDGAGAAAGYALMSIPSEQALLVEAADGAQGATLRLRMSQIQRLATELNLHMLYFRSGDVTLGVSLDSLLYSNPGKVMRQLLDNYADVTLEMIDFNTLDLMSVDDPALTRAELRNFSLVLSVVPEEQGFSISAGLHRNSDVIDLDFASTAVTISMRAASGENMLRYSNIFGEESIYAGVGTLPAIYEEELNTYEVRVENDALTCERDSREAADVRAAGLIAAYAGQGSYRADGLSYSGEGLKAGSRGPEVVRLQEALIEQGLLSGAPDGVYGRYTEWAVSTMQERFGLKPTGEADPVFLNRLYLEQ